MESSVQSESQIRDGTHRSPRVYSGDHLPAIRRELEYINRIGKRFVAAIDRFQVHRALLAALQELYSFSACCILLRGDPYELFIIPSYPLSSSFLEAMIQRIANAASAIDFPGIDVAELARTAYLDAPDELARVRGEDRMSGDEIGSGLNIPLTVESRIIGMLSLFDERPGSFDTHLLQLTTMIADYAAVALENVRLRESETALWRIAEMERHRLERIISSMTESLLITDQQGIITSLNQSAQQLFNQVQIDLSPEQPLSLHKLASASEIPWLEELANLIDYALEGNVVFNQELTIGLSGDAVPLTL